MTEEKRVHEKEHQGPWGNAQAKTPTSQNRKEIKK